MGDIKYMDDIKYNHHYKADGLEMWSRINKNDHRTHNHVRYNDDYDVYEEWKEYDQDDIFS